MVRPFQPFNEYSHGKLEIVRSVNSRVIEVNYIPPPDQLEKLHRDDQKDTANRAKILEIDNQIGRLTIFPINTFGDKPGFLQPKYTQIRKITLLGAQPVVHIRHDEAASDHRYSHSITFGPTAPLDVKIDDDQVEDAQPTADEIVNILESLPPAFTKDYDYGLGLAKPYRFILYAIEELSDCTEIEILEEGSTEINQDQDTFCITYEDFETLRKALNNTTNNSRNATSSVKITDTYNYLAEKIGKPTKQVRVGRHHYRKLFTKILQSNGEVLSEDEQEEVLSAMSNNVKTISETKTEQLAQLQRDIEVVSLEGLISHFEKLLTRGHTEKQWQEFFTVNPFALSLVFGYPVINVHGKASVGGRRLSGQGEKYTDFLVKNSMTHNTAIIEIKKPNTPLLMQSEYRNGVFPPSTELTGAITQALDQRHFFEKEIAQIKENSGIYDIRTYSVHCCLIVGTIPEDEAKQKSFELFRGNSKDVEIITYDELLAKLRNLLVFLSSQDSELVPDGILNDSPF